MDNVVFDVEFKSQVLGLTSKMKVLYPQGVDRNKNHKPPRILYLLHGLSDVHTAWSRYTSVDRYAEDRNLMVVMPSTFRGFYTDTDYGTKYWSFISEELPAICKQLFYFSDKREDTFAFGLSMGGYGALKLGLRQPERFAAVASFSGAPMGNIMAQARLSERGDSDELLNEFRALFGSTIKPNDDIFQLVDKNASEAVRSKFYIACGKADNLHVLNVMLKDKMLQKGFDIAWHEHPTASHTWDYWDACLQKALDWIDTISE